MDESSFGLVELILGFGLVLALGVWEVVRNRKALAAIRSERTKTPSDT